MLYDTYLFLDCLLISSGDLDITVIFPRMLRKLMSMEHKSLHISVHLLEEVWYCMPMNWSLSVNAPENGVPKWSLGPIWGP